MTKDSDWQADLARCGGKSNFWHEQSLVAIWVYRFGRRVDQMPFGLRRRFLTRYYWVLFRLTEVLVGISIPKNCIIGPGLRIWHFGGIFIHPNVKLGSNCTLRQGVTIGNRHNLDDVPVVEDNVEFGAYAQVLGDICIGQGAKIGAACVVLKDVPPWSTAIGNPARILVEKKTN
jgi:serine O-acetyltransferase